MHGAPPRSPRQQPRRKWPPVFANIVVRGWEGLGPPQRAPLCCVDPQGLISIPPGRLPCSFQRLPALHPAPPACRSAAETVPRAQLCPIPAPFPSPGSHLHHQDAIILCEPLPCGVVADLFWLLQSPPRVPGSVHACTGVCACSFTGCHAHRCVQPSIHPLHAQLHGCTHSCTPTHPWLTPAVCTHSAPAAPHSAPPCTLPVFRLPQLPSPQLSRVPWVGRWLCPAWHSQSPQHGGLWAPHISLPVYPAVGSPHPL